VAGAGNGIVDIFDRQGNFVRRFATGASLNAPWGITVASANFGPFSNDVLIGNFGDGTISAFDPATGDFKGQITDSTGAVISNLGLRGLTFRPDGFADPNTLYFTAGSADGQAGLFGAITHGLVSTTQITIFPTPIQLDSNATITITVAGAPGNAGTPTGNVIFQVGADTIFIAPLLQFAAGYPRGSGRNGGACHRRVLRRTRRMRWRGRCTRKSRNCVNHRYRAVWKYFSQHKCERHRAISGGLIFERSSDAEKIRFEGDKVCTDSESRIAALFIPGSAITWAT